ncbi:MAG: hypothetical protein WCF18_17080 [Chthoniobacteraceae bacterium]
MNILFSTLLGLVALLGSSPLASASSEVYARSTSTVGTGDSDAQSAPSGSVSDSYADADTQATAIGRSAAAFGVLRTFADTNLPVGSSLSSRFTTSIAAFKDDFLFDAPGLTGTTGSVTVRFTIDGSLNSVANGTSPSSAYANNTWAQAQYGFGVGIGYGTNTKTYRVFADGHTTGTPFLGIQQEAILTFTYGVPLTDVTLQVGALNAVAAQFSNYTSRSTADLEHTALWGGFAEVRDAGGAPVTNYTFSSASGLNYVVPVPEPATTSLFLLSGLVLSVTRPRPRRTAGL